MARKTPSLIEGLFNFEGRMRRSEYWVASIGLFVLRLATMFLGGEILGVDLGGAGSILALRVGTDALFLWPHAAITIKRGHDRNRPTTDTGVLLATMYGLSWTSAALLPSGALIAVGVIAVAFLILVLYFVIDYGFIDGTQGPNRYGPSPKGIGPQARQQDIATVFE